MPAEPAHRTAGSRRRRGIFQALPPRNRLTAPISSANSCAMTSSVWMMPSRGRELDRIIIRMPPDALLTQQLIGFAQRQRKEHQHADQAACQHTPDEEARIRHGGGRAQLFVNSSGGRNKISAGAQEDKPQSMPSISGLPPEPSRGEKSRQRIRRQGQQRKQEERTGSGNLSANASRLTPVPVGRAQRNAAQSVSIRQVVRCACGRRVCWVKTTAAQSSDAQQKSSIRLSRMSSTFPMG